MIQMIFLQDNQLILLFKKENGGLINQNNSRSYRHKRQTTRQSINPGDDAVMYIPISTGSSCPAGSNSVADASVNGISQVIICTFFFYQ